MRRIDELADIVFIARRKFDLIKSPKDEGKLISLPREENLPPAQESQAPEPEVITQDSRDQDLLH